MYVVFYLQPLPANPFELNRECLPVRDHINDDTMNHHRLAKYLTYHIHLVLRILNAADRTALDPALVFAYSYKASAL